MVSKVKLIGDIVIVKRKRDKENDMKELTPQRKSASGIEIVENQDSGPKKGGKITW